MINRFERRKDKYMKALKIQQKLKQRWYRKSIINKRKPSEAIIDPIDILEKQNDTKTFKTLVSEIKDDKSNCLSLRKIDAKKRLNLVMEKKSALDMQIEMLQNDDPKSTKTHQDHREDMKHNADGKPIANIMPIFEVQFEKLGASVDTRITRIDGEQSKNSKSLNNKNKELIPYKGLYEISEDILDRPYRPQPQLAEDMKVWEAQLDRDIKTTRRQVNNDSNLTPKVKRSRFGKRNEVFLFPDQTTNLIKQNTNIHSSLKGQNLDEATLNAKVKQFLRRPSISFNANLVNNLHLSTQKSEPDNYFKIDPKLNKNVSDPSLNKKSSFIPNIKKPRDRRSVEKRMESIVNFDPLSLVNNKALKKHRASLDWHDYAKMRMPYLPDIFKTAEETQTLAKSISNIDIKSIKHR